MLSKCGLFSLGSGKPLQRKKKSYAELQGCAVHLLAPCSYLNSNELKLVKLQFFLPHWHELRSKCSITTSSSWVTYWSAQTECFQPCRKFYWTLLLSALSRVCLRKGWGRWQTRFHHCLVSPMGHWHELPCWVPVYALSLLYYRAPFLLIHLWG